MGKLRLLFKSEFVVSISRWRNPRSFHFFFHSKVRFFPRWLPQAAAAAVVCVSAVLAPHDDRHGVDGVRLRPCAARAVLAGSVARVEVSQAGNHQELKVKLASK